MSGEKGEGSETLSPQKTEKGTTKYLEGSPERRPRRISNVQPNDAHGDHQ